MAFLRRIRNFTVQPIWSRAVLSSMWGLQCSDAHSVTPFSWWKWLYSPKVNGSETAASAGFFPLWFQETYWIRYVFIGQMLHGAGEYQLFLSRMPLQCRSGQNGHRGLTWVDKADRLTEVLRCSPDGEFRQLWSLPELGAKKKFSRNDWSTVKSGAAKGKGCNVLWHRGCLLLPFFYECRHTLLE